MPTPLIARKAPFVQASDPGTFWWCACGQSKTQPFCDGAHKGTGFAPLKVEVPAAKTIAWCGCKHSKKSAFCDGSHASCLDRRIFNPTRRGVRRERAPAQVKPVA